MAPRRTRSPFTRLYLVREDAPAETLAVRAADAAAAWFSFGTQAAASLDPQETSRWTLCADIAADAPSRHLGLSLARRGDWGAARARGRERLADRGAGAGTRWRNTHRAFPCG